MEGKDLVYSVQDQVKTVVMGLLDIEEGSAGELLFDQVTSIGASAIPFGSAALNAYKFYRLNKRLNDHLAELRQINAKVQKLEESHKELVTQKAFPLIMESLNNEQEEEKIKIILNGLENTVNRSDVEESMIRAYYDVLNTLRINEILHLMKFDKRAANESNKDFVEYMELLLDRTSEGRNRLDEVEGYKTYVEQKLEQQGLIIKPRTWGALSGERVPYDDSKISLSKFGENFIDFFKSKEKKGD
ncbi:hypothetical protein [Brevibacillus brevis]|uniref:hypothetical protein n=1 Tax=Brevibacillus brevis TaxID=1393 RepID=UPI000D0F39BA|nr:hypothetical protein [Brevibacillus brevis]PSJ68695.1 hypothetical protein C7J99_13680 [Brevibacillus brevis]RED33135.1 hypothetical protein DES34_103452 [Brevibacillus brevis]GEC93307.1 hypothetical protein BBR01nite_56380 [Brevibacillus brevis]VEF90805.1 Uncharacterised protein [Brevibacillus brevis]